MLPGWALPDLIVDGLYLSGSEAEEDKELLDRLGITHVLQVGEELSPTHAGSLAYHSIPIDDHEAVDIVSWFPKAFAFIDQARASGGRVLVHCRAGVSRSATLVTAWVMQQRGLSAPDALEVVRERRPRICPNAGFLCQLLEFEQLGCDASKFPGWHHVRWLGNPLAQAADEMLAKLLGLPWLPSGQQQQQDNAGGADADWAVSTEMLHSPFAQLATAAAAASEQDERADFDSRAVAAAAAPTQPTSAARAGAASAVEMYRGSAGAAGGSCQDAAGVTLQELGSLGAEAPGSSSLRCCC